ncbi:hypothetical protein Q7P37_000543 [Cladosporium fusiforme]
MSSSYPQLLPRPSPEPEDDNTYHAANGLHPLTTPVSNTFQFSSGPESHDLNFFQWNAMMGQSHGNPHQSFDAQQAFNPGEPLNPSQAMHATQMFETMQDDSLSHSMDESQDFNAAQGLDASQAVNGSWGRFVTDNQAFQDPFAMGYGLGGQAFNTAGRTPSSGGELEPPSPLTGPNGRHFSSNRRRQHLTVSRASPADIKPTVPAFVDNNVRQSIEQDNRLQQHPNHTGFGQPEHRRVSGDSSHASSNQHIQSSQNNRVAIPQLSVAQQPLPTARPSIAPANGPMAQPITVPARPKPGRKPLPQEDAQDRRRVQNRMAQRNFRDKRAQKVSELTADNDRLRKEKDDTVKKYSNQVENQRQEINRLKRKAEALESDLKAANDRVAAAENHNHSYGSMKRLKDAGFPNPRLDATTTSASLPSITTSWRGPVGDYTEAAKYTETPSNSMMTPPEEGWPETDMSSFWTSRNPRRQSNANEDNGTQWLGSGMDIDHREDDGCGFCTDESNCSCLQSKKAVAESSATTTIAPGGCDACIADPARAEACRALAAKTDYSPMPAAGGASSSAPEQRNDSMAAPPLPSSTSRMMSCSKFIDRVENQGLGQRVPSISELFGGITSQSIHSYPSSSGAGAGYDVNEQEAAQVLQNMSRRPSGPIPQGPPS